MKLSDIPTERLKQAIENFGSSTAKEITFFQYDRLDRPVQPESEGLEVASTSTFTKNEILDELEARQFRQELRD